MQILMTEVGLCDTVDPLGGSYFIESVTDRMEEAIAAIQDQLDASGGVVRGVAEGRVQAEVNRQAWERQRKLESGELRKVGVNCFREGDDAHEVELHPYREQEANAQIDRLNARRRERHEDGVKKALAELKAVARSDKNVMPAVIAAVEAYATVGEICRELKDVFGVYREPSRW
jgi:methylmalonyl-CoA mutase N-terminal domain/subunit